MAFTDSPTALLGLSIITLYIVYNRLSLYLRRRAFKKQHGCQPCPRVYHKDPIFASDALRESLAAAKERRLMAKNRERFEKMGAYTYHTRLITLPWIVTAEPENVKTVLSLKFKDYSLGNRVDTFSALLGDGIFNSDGERWANSRHLLRPNFAREQLADLDSFERHIGKLLKHIPQDGATVDLQKLFFRFTLDSATEFLFHYSTNSLDFGENGEKEAESLFADAFSTATADIAQQFRWGIFKRFRAGRVKGEEAVKTCHEYVERFVDDAIQWRREREARRAEGKTDDDLDAGGKSDRYVFIHELVMQTTDRTRLRNELINVLLAGRDTTASVLGNLFFELAQQPALWAELREEVAILEGRPPTYEELKNFKLVRYCLNEALRLYPVVPGNTRLAIRDTVLPLGGGIDSKSPLFVPAGTTVGYNPFIMHRRPDIYGPDADSFRPSRWENLRTSWEYLPFNGGPRICLGQQYALTEAGYVTVRLLQNFARMDSRDVNGGVWVEGLSLTLCSGNGTLVGMFAE